MSGPKEPKIENRILASELDMTTKVNLFKVLDRGPTECESYLIHQLLECDERYKNNHIDLDSRFREEFNQP